MQCIAGPPPHSGRGGIGIRLGRGPDLDCNGGATGAGKTDSALPCAFDAVQAKTDAVACGAEVRARERDRLCPSLRFRCRSCAD